MAFNPDRFVVIDGVQINKARALRDGLIDDKGKIVRRPGDDAPDSEGPGSTRARNSGSARRGRGGVTEAVGGTPAVPVVTTPPAAGSTPPSGDSGTPATGTAPAVG